MLYLSRKIGESIIINDKIEVKVVDVKGSNVKLGFEFPKSASILRKEIYDKVVEENKRAAEAAINPDNEDFFTKFLKTRSDRDNQLEEESNKSD